MQESHIPAQPALLLYHRTIGAEYDSRAQKILATLAATRGIHGRAILWERENRSRSGLFQFGGDYKVKRLPVASKKRPRPGPLFSFLEIVQEAVHSYQEARAKHVSILVVQNHRQFIFIWLMALLRPRHIRRVVWDLRELPTGFLVRESRRARLFAHLLRTCDSVMVTNASRLAYMRDVYGDGSLDHAHVLPNYVSGAFADAKPEPLPSDLRQWLRGRRFFYVQNPSHEQRYPYQTVRAVLDGTDKALVVTGRISVQALERLKAQYGPEFEERVYLAGMLPEERLIPILDAAHASIILYDASHPNNDCCDANRLYQAVARGIPVITGNNKGMTSVVEPLRNGVVLDDDGRDHAVLVAGLRRLDAIYDEARRNAAAHKAKCLWKSNETVLLRAVLGEE